MVWRPDATGRLSTRRTRRCSTDMSVQIILEVIAAAGCGKLFSLLGHLIRLLDENPILIRRTEIHIDAPYLVAREHKKLGVAKPFSAFGRAPVGHEGRVAVDKDSFQLMSLDPFGVLPATREIARLVDAIVVGAGETKVVGERILDGVTVVRHVRCKDRSDDIGLAGHSAALLLHHGEIRLGFLHDSRTGW